LPDSWSPHFQATLTPDEAASLISRFALFSGLIGALVQPFFGGLLFDAIGLRPYLITLVVLLGLFVCSLPARSYALQYAGLALGGGLLINCWGVVNLQWGTRVVSPSRVGASFGLLFALAGSTQIVASQLIEPLADLLGAATAQQRVLWPLLCLGGLAVGMGLLHSAALACHKLPTQEELLLLDEGAPESLLSFARTTTFTSGTTPLRGTRGVTECTLPDTLREADVERRLSFGHGFGD